MLSELHKWIKLIRKEAVVENIREIQQNPSEYSFFRVDKAELFG